jgi:hypothetical protein
MLSERKRMPCLENQGIDYNNSRYEYDSGLALMNSYISASGTGCASAQTITLNPSNDGVRYTPVRAPSIEKATTNLIAIYADSVLAKGQFDTQNTPETILSHRSEPTHVTRHCARPVHRPLRVEYHTSRSAHRPCAVANGWAGEAGLLSSKLGELDKQYKIDSTRRRIYAGERAKSLAKICSQPPEVPFRTVRNTGAGTNCQTEHDLMAN